MTNPSSSPDPSSRRQNPLEWVCQHVLPNCEKALALTELGRERPLNPRERLSLRYHGRLCPFCGCALGKFEAARARYDEACRVRAEQASETKPRTEPS